METVTEKPFEGIHKQVGGSVGASGESSADSSCGVTFDGFDTHAEVLAVLDKHIADANAGPDPWAVLAARIADQPLPDYRGELSRIAADVDALTGSGLGRPGYFSLKTELVIDIQPGNGRDDEVTARSVDAVAQMLLGRDGEPNQMVGGSWHYSAYGTRGPIQVRIYNTVSTEWAERQKAADEVAKLRAELATAEADAKRLRERLAEHEQPPCVASMHIPDQGATCSVCGAADVTAADAEPLVSEATIEAVGRFQDQQEFDRLRREARTEDEVARLAELGEKLGLDYRVYDRATAVAAAKPDTLGVPMGHHGGETCQYVEDGLGAPRCGAAIRPAFDPRKGWVHADVGHDHMAVGPAS
jgi:hypothetical protein